MKFLLDTCALSELRKRNANQGFKEWFEAADAKNLLISVVSIGELIKGTLLLEEGRLKRELTLWVKDLENEFMEGVVGIDLETAHIWGEVTSKAQKTGRIISANDGLIAATALQHGLHLVTRNTADFEPTGALFLDPWSH